MDSGWAAPALAAAALLLGYALQISNGHLDSNALAATGGAMLLCTAAVFIRPSSGAGEGMACWLLAAGMALQLGLLSTAPPGVYLRTTPEGFSQFVRGLASAGVVSGALLMTDRRVKQFLIPLLLLLHAALGLWLIHASPRPAIDVFVFQRDAVQALLAGRNPYAMTFPNIYGHGHFYGPGMVENGRTTFGFLYPPLSLLLSVPGALLGDVRYSQLAAITGAGALMAYARPGRLGALAAAVFLFTPRGFFVLEQAWTEPFILLGAAAVVFCACRFRFGLPYALGALLAVKQHLALALPLTLLLFPRPLRWSEVWSVWGRALGLAVAVTLPFALWDVTAFFRSAVAAQFHQPFRPDALSVLAYVAGKGGPQLSAAVSILPAGVALLLALWRAPRSPSGFAASVALTYGLFFLFNKQAFCNYYYFVVGALCVAAAAWRGVTATGEPTPPIPREPSSQ